MKGTLILAGLFSSVLAAGCGQSATPTGPSAIPAGAQEARGGQTTVPLVGQLSGTQTVTPQTPPFAFVDANGTGEATLVGRFQIALPHTVNFATSMATGTCTLTAANGDTITADFTGQAQVGAVVTIVEQATITGGTGRFEGASGSFTLHREFTPATGVMTGSMEGSVTMTMPGAR